MEQRIYKPAYSFEFYFAILLAFSVVGAIFIGWYFGFNVFIPEVLLVGIMFLFFILQLPITFIRQIEFRYDGFLIKRYLLPEKMEYYTNIVDVHDTSIKISRITYTFKPLFVKNANGLFRIIDGLVSEGKINRHQFSGEISRHNQTYRHAILPSGIIAIILWAFLQYTYPSLQNYFGKTGFILLFLPISLLVSSLIKAKETP